MEWRNRSAFLINVEKLETKFRSRNSKIILCTPNPKKLFSSFQLFSFSLCSNEMYKQVAKTNKENVY